MASEWPIRISIYGAGDAAPQFSDLGSLIHHQLADLAEVATNRYVAAVAQLDAFRTPCLRWILDSRGRTRPEEFSNEVNTGDPAELLDFFLWAEEQAPAKLDVLVLSGHGLAWQDDVVLDAWGRPGRSLGKRRVPAARRKPVSRSTLKSRVTKAILMDGDIEGPGQDFLTNIELAIALDNIYQKKGKKIDVLVFDACLMSSAEVLFELTPSVTFAVGGVDEISGSGYNHSGAARLMTDRRDSIDALTAARSFPVSFTDLRDTDSCVAVNIGSASFDNFVRSFADFSRSVHEWISTDPANLDKAATALVRASAQHLEYRGSVADILELRRGLATESAPAEIMSLLDASITQAEKCIVEKKLGRRYSGFCGISIYSPALREEYAQNRAEYARLRFGRETGWPIVLDRILGM